MASLHGVRVVPDDRSRLRSSCPALASSPVIASPLVSVASVRVSLIVSTKQRTADAARPAVLFG